MAEIDGGFIEPIKANANLFRFITKLYDIKIDVNNHDCAYKHTSYIGVHTIRSCGFYEKVFRTFLNIDRNVSELDTIKQIFDRISNLINNKRFFAEEMAYYAIILYACGFHIELKQLRHLNEYNFYFGDNVESVYKIVLPAFLFDFIDARLLNLLKNTIEKTKTEHPEIYEETKNQILCYVDIDKITDSISFTLQKTEEE